MCISVFLSRDQIGLVSIIDNNTESSIDIVRGSWSDSWIGVHLCDFNLVLVDEI